MAREPRRPNLLNRGPSAPCVDGAQRADALIKLADYHRKAMEARRAEGFRAFVLLAAFYGAVLFQTDELLKPFDGVVSATVLLSTFLIASFLAFAHAMREHAKRNELDRRRYVSAEAEAWRLLDAHRWEVFFDDFVGKGKAFVPIRTRPAQLRSNWASTEVLLIAFFLLLLVLVRIWYPVWNVV